MSKASDWLETELINHIFRSATFAKPSGLYIALCANVPVDSDTGALSGKEIANAGSYARVALAPSNSNWAATSGTDGQTSNAAAIEFTAASADWGNISGVAITNNGTYGAGNMLVFGSLTTPKTIQNGDQFKFNIGDLVITVA